MQKKTEQHKRRSKLEPHCRKANKTLTNTVAQVNITGGKHSKVVDVSNLNETLGEVTEKALKDVLSFDQLFDPFGEIEQVDIQRDPISGRCRGFAFVHYCKSDDAKEAIKKMNGFLIKGHPLKVSTVSYDHSMLVGSTLNLDDENGGFLSSAEAKALLIQKLSHSSHMGCKLVITQLKECQKELKSWLARGTIFPLCLPPSCCSQT